jgi:hypothetical protein
MTLPLDLRGFTLPSSSSFMFWGEQCWSTANEAITGRILQPTDVMKTIILTTDLDPCLVFGWNVNHLLGCQHPHQGSCHPLSR